MFSKINIKYYPPVLTQIDLVWKRIDLKNKMTYNISIKQENYDIQGYTAHVTFVLCISI